MVCKPSTLAMCSAHFERVKPACPLCHSTTSSTGEARHPLVKDLSNVVDGSSVHSKQPFSISVGV